MTDQTRAAQNVGLNILALCQATVDQTTLALSQRVDALQIKLDRLAATAERLQDLEARFDEFDASVGKLRARVNRGYDDQSDETTMEHKRLCDQYVTLTRNDVAEVVRLRNSREAPAIPDALRNAHRARLAADVVDLLLAADTVDAGGLVAYIEGGRVPAQLTALEVGRVRRLVADFVRLKEEIRRLPGPQRFAAWSEAMPIEHCELWAGGDKQWPVTVTVAPAYLVKERMVAGPWVLTEPAPARHAARPLPEQREAGPAPDRYDDAAQVGPAELAPATATVADGLSGGAGRGGSAGHGAAGHGAAASGAAERGAAGRDGAEHGQGAPTRRRRAVGSATVESPEPETAHYEAAQPEPAGFEPVGFEPAGFGSTRPEAAEPEPEKGARRWRPFSGNKGQTRDTER